MAGSKGSSFRAAFDGLLPKGLQWYWRGDFVKELTDEAIDAHIAQAQKLPSPLSLMHLYPIDGAVRRIGKSDTAWNTRDATWSMVIAGIDPNPQKAGEITRWTKGYWEAVHPYSADGGYVNFMMDDGDDDRLKATYGDNYDRLVALKDKGDEYVTKVFDLREDLAQRAAIDLLASEATPISVEQAKARDKLWTPGSERAATGCGPSAVT